MCVCEHIEVILEGPKESAKEAQRLMLHDMEHPFQSPLLVDLKVDSDIADTCTWMRILLPQHICLPQYTVYPSTPGLFHIPQHYVLVHYCMHDYILQ